MKPDVHSELSVALERALALKVLIRQIAARIESDPELIAVSNLAAREAEELFADLDRIDDHVAEHGLASKVAA